ncbi:unnamed protein product [Caenorhabditis brenneri]
MSLLAFFVFNLALVLAHPPHRVELATAKLAREVDGHRLTGKPMLKVTSPLEDMKITPGASYTLYCEILSVPSAAVQWLFNGKRIQGSMELNVEEKMLNLRHKYVESGILASTYTIENPSEKDSGVYTCVAYNGHDTVRSDAEIEVVGDEAAEVKPTEGAAPRIVQWTESRFEMQGNVATLVCRSNTPSEWTWTFEGEKINSKIGRYQIMPYGDLRIYDIAWEDMGEYFCTARNQFGEIRQETFLYPTAKKEE